MSAAAGRVLLGVVPVERMYIFGEWGNFLGRTPEGLWISYLSKSPDGHGTGVVLDVFPKRPSDEEFSRGPTPPVSVTAKEFQKMQTELGNLRASLERLSAQFAAAANPAKPGPIMACTTSHTEPAAPPHAANGTPAGVDLRAAETGGKS